MVSSVQEHAVAAQSGAKPPNDDLIQREIKYFRDFSAIFTDAIRSSDFKANIALLFLPLLMVPILSAHERGLEGVPLWVVLAPFLAAYFFLILAIFPGATSGRKRARSTCRGQPGHITSSSPTIRSSSSRR